MWQADLKGATGVDTSNLTPKSELANLKFETDEIDIDKLKAVLDDLSKLSNVVDSDVVIRSRKKIDKIRKYKKIAHSNHILAWKSKGLSDESIKHPSTSDNSLKLGINYIGNTKIQLEFNGSRLKQEKITFNHKIILNFYIVYEIYFCK